MVLASLPILCPFLILLIRLNSVSSLRKAVLDSVVLWSALLVFITETLSHLNFFNRSGLLSTWLIVCFWLILAIYKKQALSGFKSVFSSTKNLYAENILAISALVFILVVTLIGAIKSPPNNWDGHSYHLSRIMHWIQNGSIRHYPTAMEKQLIFPPFAEYVIAHLMILAQNDALSNLVQWFSFVLLILVTSQIGAKLGLSLKSQIGVAFFSASLPMAILESGSVQNDLVTASWCLIFVNGCLDRVFDRQKSNQNTNWMDECILGFSAGLAVLTKGTAPIYLLPFAVWLLVETVKTFGFKASFRLVIPAICALIINGGHFLRNLEVFHVPLSTPPGLSLSNEKHSVGVIVSNLVRNGFLHIPLPGRYSGLSRKIVDLIHRPLGLDSFDPETSFEGAVFAAPILPRSEHHSGNPVHFLLGGLALIFILQDSEKRNDSILKKYLGAFLGVVLLFCFLLKWQQYNSRLHLTMFFLAAPLIIAGLRQHQAVLKIGMLSAFVLAMVPLFASKNRPWFGPHSIFTNRREVQYFVERPELLKEFEALTSQLKQGGCRNIGLINAGHETWEYPLWVMLKSSEPKFRLEYVNVHQKSGKIGLVTPFSPCAIVSLWSIGKV